MCGSRLAETFADSGPQVERAYVDSVPEIVWTFADKEQSQTSCTDCRERPSAQGGSPSFHGWLSEIGP